jgi:hypothetical protein
MPDLLLRGGRPWGVNAPADVLIRDGSSSGSGRTSRSRPSPGCVPPESPSPAATTASATCGARSGAATCWKGPCISPTAVVHTNVRLPGDQPAVRLYLSVNDNNFGDNTGSWTADIKEGG